MLLSADGVAECLEIAPDLFVLATAKAFEIVHEFHCLVPIVRVTILLHSRSHRLTGGLYVLLLPQALRKLQMIAVIMQLSTKNTMMSKTIPQSLIASSRKRLSLPFCTTLHPCR